ncbi:MAG: hypothetical protein H7X89_00140 [Rhizobiales bacterium]|nr:hypothetical protein [Hyphomicrobiales bacterium]
MDIYIVVVERRADAARNSLWIHASNSRTAKNNALRIAGKSDFTVIKVELLADMVTIELALPKRKARKKVPKRDKAKAGAKSPRRRARKKGGDAKPAKRKSKRRRG